MATANCSSDLGFLREHDFIPDEDDVSGLEVDHEGEQKAITQVIAAYSIRGDDHQAELLRKFRRAMLEAKKLVANIERYSLQLSNEK